MKSRFKLKLTITLVAFALIISITLAAIDQIRLKEQAIRSKEEHVQQDVVMVKHSIEMLEKAYYLFGQHIAIQMEESSRYLIALYKEQPEIATWDYQELKQKLGFDIYIIDEQNTVVQSSSLDDIGLNFQRCCSKLAQVLDQRRAAGSFYHDGIDMEQVSGSLQKFSYMATPDKKYLIELSYALQDGDIFQQFNFFETIQQIVNNNASLNEINVLNTGGFVLGENPIPQRLTKERRTAFQQALRSKEAAVIDGVWNDEPARYLYVSYNSNLDTGVTQNKVLEIIYNEHDLQQILRENRQTFAVQLLLAIGFACALALLISRWVAKPMYLAFHDSLTGVYNRAAFEDLLKTTLKESTGTTALLMMDIDNFKLVNDDLGHDRGDQLLKDVAAAIQDTVRSKDMTIRLGGDEFILIMPSADEVLAKHMATQIIANIDEVFAIQLESFKDKVTVSVGIALAPEHGIDADSLFKHADIALYGAKSKGKNQYQLYTEI